MIQCRDCCLPCGFSFLPHPSSYPSTFIIASIVPSWCNSQLHRQISVVPIPASSNDTSPSSVTFHQKLTQRRVTFSNYGLSTSSCRSSWWQSTKDHAANQKDRSDTCGCSHWSTAQDPRSSPTICWPQPFCKTEHLDEHCWLGGNSSGLSSINSTCSSPLPSLAIQPAPPPGQPVPAPTSPMQPDLIYTRFQQRKPSFSRIISFLIFIYFHPPYFMSQFTAQLTCLIRVPPFTFLLYLSFALSFSLAIFTLHFSCLSIRFGQSSPVDVDPLLNNHQSCFACSAISVVPLAFKQPSELFRLNSHQCCSLLNGHQCRFARY